MTRPAAIVTGGARGIGLACAEALADAGFDILVADLAEQAPDGLDTDISARGAKLAYVSCDVANLDSHAVLLDAAGQRGAALGREAKPADAPGTIGAFAGPAFDAGDIAAHLAAFEIARLKS